MYGVFDLDFFHHNYQLPDMCVNKNLKIIHVQVLGHVSATYLLCLFWRGFILSYMIITLNLWCVCGDHSIDAVSNYEKNGIQNTIYSIFSLHSFSFPLMYQSLQLLSVRYLWNKNSLHELGDITWPNSGVLQSIRTPSLAIIGTVFLVVFTGEVPPLL